MQLFTGRTCFSSTKFAFSVEKDDFVQYKKQHKQYSDTYFSLPLPSSLFFLLALPLPLFFPSRFLKNYYTSFTSVRIREVSLQFSIRLSLLMVGSKRYVPMSIYDQRPFVNCLFQFKTIRSVKFSVQGCVRVRK